MVVTRILLLCSALAGCGQDEVGLIIAHRAQGVGVVGENLADNVPRVFAAGFGAEIDLRGDGSRLFELGHFVANGDTLGDVLDGLEERWEPSFVGQVLFLDIANDRADLVSNTLIDYLYGRIPGTPLEDVRYIIQSSNEESLGRLRAAHLQREDALDLRFALTYWVSPEYTTSLWLDLVTTNVRELGEYKHAKPVILFGVETRASYRRARESRNEVLGFVTNHPRRLERL